MTATKTLSYLDTEIDDPSWSGPMAVSVEYAISYDEIVHLEVTNIENSQPVSLTPAQEKAIIEEIWEDVSQNG